MKHALGIDIGSTTVKVTVIDESHTILFSDYKRHFANIKGTLQTLLSEARAKLGNLTIHPTVTGSGGMSISEYLHIPFCHAYVFHHVLIFSHSDMRIILSSPLQETVALHTRSAFVFSLPADPGYGSQKAGTVYKDAADFQKALL